MELNTNNNYGQDSMDYESRPNPNDALFGGSSMDEPYQIRSTYTPAPAKKSGSASAIIAIVIIAVCALIIGGVVSSKKKAEKEARRFDGTYVVTKMKVEGFELDMEKFTMMTGATISGSITIDGTKGYVQMDLQGYGTSQTTGGECEIELKGNTIIATKNGESITFEHVTEGEDEYITFTEEGNILYFYKQ